MGVLKVEVGGYEIMQFYIRIYLQSTGTTTNIFLGYEL